jgi:hypothetical protein
MEHYFKDSTPNLLDMLHFVRQMLRRELADHPVAARRYWIEILGAAMYLRDRLRVVWHPRCKFCWIPITCLSRADPESFAKRIGAKMSVADERALARWMALLKQHGQKFAEWHPCHHCNATSPLPQYMQDMLARFTEYLRSRSEPRLRARRSRLSSRRLRLRRLVRPEKTVHTGRSDGTAEEPFCLRHHASPSGRGPPLMRARSRSKSIRPVRWKLAEKLRREIIEAPRGTIRLRRTFEFCFNAASYEQ